MKDNLLYIMHVDWNWIKQRPHFIAEGLSQRYNLFICCPVTRNRKAALSENGKADCSYIKYLKNPFRRYAKWLYVLNNVVLRLYFGIIIKITKPKYIYITFPEMIEYIPSKFKGSVIYDCMDDSLELQKNEKFKKLLSASEQKLVNRADAILCSSDYLSSKIKERYRFDSSKVTIVNNAYSGEIINSETKENVQQKDRFKICYIGTISSWFDYELLESSIRKFDNIEYHIIGPSEKKYSDNLHIKFYGTIKHEDLYETVKDFDCFIMPFKINELVKSVNPVKIYEYLNFDKRIISIFYDELGKFKDVVDFYNNEQEYFMLIKNLIDIRFEKKYTKDKRIEMLSKNSWEDRVLLIDKVIKNLKSIEV